MSQLLTVNFCDRNHSIISVLFHHENFECDAIFHGMFYLEICLFLSNVCNMHLLYEIDSIFFVIYHILSSN